MNRAEEHPMYNVTERFHKFQEWRTATGFEIASIEQEISFPDRNLVVLPTITAALPCTMKGSMTVSGLLHQQS